MMELCGMQVLEFRTIFVTFRMLEEKYMQFNFEDNLLLKVKPGL